MGQARHHYERAFEAFLRARQWPYVSVNEAKRALMPPGVMAHLQGHLDARIDTSGSRAGDRHLGSGSAAADAPFKNFDFVIYGASGNLLVDIKGRRIANRGRPGTGGRLECWVTLDDIESLGRWEMLFGSGFEAAFVFLYWCDGYPPDPLFQEIFDHDDRWYAIRTVLLADYRQHMKTRSPRWGTVDLPAARFEAVSRPFSQARPLERGLSGNDRDQEESGRADGASRRGLPNGQPELDGGPVTPALEPFCPPERTID